MPWGWAERCVLIGLMIFATHCDEKNHFFGRMQLARFPEGELKVECCGGVWEMP